MITSALAGCALAIAGNKGLDSFYEHWLPNHFDFPATGVSLYCVNSSFM